MMDSSVVIIPLQVYNELMETKIRADIIVERLAHSDFFSKEDILYLLGTELSIELAQELHDKAKKEYEKWEKGLLSPDED